MYIYNFSNNLLKYLIFNIFPNYSFKSIIVNHLMYYLAIIKLKGNFITYMLAFKYIS